MNSLYSIFSCSLCQGMDAVCIESLLKTAEMHIKRFRRGECIFRMDQPISHIGLISAGSVEIQKILPSGKAVTFMYKKAGEIIAEGAIFSSLPSYPCQVVAREKTDIILLPKQYFCRIITTNPQLAANVLALLSDKIVMLNKKVELLSFSSIQSKIAFSLLHCLPVTDNNQIELPYPKKVWAEFLNVSRPSLCRELKKISDQGILQIIKRTIIIRNRSSLEKMLNT